MITNVKTQKNCTMLDFGYGDICVASGVMENELGEEVGFIAFSNQEPREVGTPGKVKVGTIINIKDCDAIMTFNKEQSVDVLINTLQHIKDGIYKK